MLYPFTGALHILSVGLILVAVWYSLIAKRQSVSNLKKRWISWFILFLLYNVFLGLPSLLGGRFPEVIKIAGILYIAGLFALGLGAWNGFVMGLSFLGISQKTREFLSRAYLTSLVLILLLFGIFFENPTASADGNWIFWHSNRFLTLAYSSLMAIAAWTFGYSFFQRLVQWQGWKMRFCSICMGSGSFILPLAAFFYFAGTNTAHLAIAFIFVLTGLLFLLSGNIVARHLNTA